MSTEAGEPIAAIGIGGAGARLAPLVSETLGADLVLASHDPADLGTDGLEISTGPLINPSAKTIRGYAMARMDALRDRLSEYHTGVLVANLAGRSGQALAPLVSELFKERTLITFAVMPFSHERDRIFGAGVALRRLRADSGCTIIIDNDALAAANPDLSARACCRLADPAIAAIAASIKDRRVPDGTGVLAPSREGLSPEESLREALRAMYGSAPPSSVSGSAVHVLGGGIPTGMMKILSELGRGAGEGAATVVEAGTGHSGIALLSGLHGSTKFDSYDPLGDIPATDTLDWEIPDSSYDWGLGGYQLEK